MRELSVRRRESQVKVGSKVLSSEVTDSSPSLGGVNIYE